MADNNSLFSSYIRTDTSFKTPIQSNYDYLNISARPLFVKVRKIINEWFSRYQAPDIKKHQMISEFCSKDDKTHYSAFFELYLYTLFSNLEYEIIVEPVMSNGTKPDFLLISPSKKQILLEASSVFPDTIFGARKQLEEWLINELEKRIHSPNFFLDINKINAPNDNPPIAKIARCIEKKLNALDVDEVSNYIASHQHLGFKAFPIIQCQHESWNVEFKAHPKNAKARSRPTSQTIGIQSWVVHTIDDISPIRSSIKRKSGHYGDLDSPYILALNIFSETSSEEDIFEALFGDLVVYFSTESEKSSISNKPNGVWYGPRGYQKTRMSALLTFNDLTPFLIGKKEPTLWHHPSAEYPIDASSWVLRQKIPNMVTGKLQTTQSKFAKQNLNFDYLELNKLFNEKP